MGRHDPGPRFGGAAETGVGDLHFHSALNSAVSAPGEPSDPRFHSRRQNLPGATNLPVQLAYLDYNATTPVDERVLGVMVPLFAEGFGNPSSGHASGRAAAQVEEARRSVAGAVGMGASDVIFTSGATEANNLALSGLRAGLRRNIRILAGATEHKSVLRTCGSLADDGSECGIIPVRRDGTIDTDALDAMLTDDTDVVSVMAANSETGVVHPIEEVAKIGLSRIQTPWRPPRSACCVQS